ncbi:MAG: PQQ-binding-like beta-propeller repeat protein [Planctomycetota bacterium]
MQLRLNIFLSVSLAMFAAHLPSTFAQDSEQWTRFRGDAGTGIAESAPPTEWNESDNFKWKTDLPGQGWSSPVYANGLVWMTSAIIQEASQEEIDRRLSGDRLAGIKTLAASVEFHALCVNLETGELLHDITLGSTDEVQPINPMNSYASPTPVISGDRVVCHFGNYGTWCLDAASGEELWKQEFIVDHSVGPGSSPIVSGDNVVLVCDGMDQQYIAAVDLSTGEPKWKTERPPIRAGDGEQRKAYCTPLIAEIDGRSQLVVTGAQWICGYDPQNGEELWRLDHGNGFSITPMPVLVEELVIFATGYGDGRVVAVDPGEGELPDSAVAWKSPNAPSMPSFISNDGAVFAVTDRGVLVAIDAETGEEISKKRMISNVSSSPLLAGGNLYIGNRDGEMVVVSCDPEMEVLSKFDFGSPVYASPCVIGNDLLIRTADSLIRITE